MKFFKVLILMLVVAASAVAQERSLSKAEAQDSVESIYNEWKKAEAARLQANVEHACIRQDTNELKILTRVFGKAPEGGRSLWISMHGGGGAPKELNDEQWHNQIRLYRPEEGIVVAPRAPWDAWNMWFQDPIDSLFEELIRTMVVCEGVNPDRVYLMGYSAGGDGVWRLAPRMADHWAAASMMAGHPGDVRLENVRNIPFSIWVGGADSAYDRNVRVAERGAELDSLQKCDPEGYVHETHVVEGMPHWMYRKDTVAVAWMEQFTRNTRPRYVVWRQEEVVRPMFYWIEVPQDEMKRGNTVVVRIEGNDIHISKCDYSHLTLYLDDYMVNLDKPVTVYYGEKRVMRTKAKRLASVIRSTLKRRGDRGYVFPAKVEVKIR